MDTQIQLIDRALLTEVVSEAIARIACNEIERLATASPVSDTARQIVSALRSYAKDLPGGLTPTYDEWGALLYLLWYHAHQINVAYRLIRALALQGVSVPDLSRGASFADIACGAGAWNFGVVLASAETMLNMGPVPSNRAELQVYAIDTSPPMLSIGEKLWEGFREIIKEYEYRGLHALVRASDALSVSWCPVASQGAADSSFSSLIPTDNIRCLSLMHGVYRNNPEIREGVEALVARLQPCHVLMTCHDDTVSKSRIEAVLTGGQQTHGYQRQSLPEVPLQMNGQLPKVDKVRRHLFERFIKPSRGDLSISDAQFAENYLTSRSVNWKLNDDAFFWYRKT